MSKTSTTIYDYDSSDDELEPLPKVVVKPQPDFKILYDLGNAILHHRSLFTAYKKAKGKINFKSKPGCLAINKFLTDNDTSGKLTPDLIVEGAKLLSRKLNPSQEARIQKITNVVISTHAIFKKIKEIVIQHSKDSIISIINLECFFALNQYLKQKTDVDSKKK